jgi:phosphatidylglycerophosphatase A
MNELQTFSIMVEMAAAILGLLIWLQRRKTYGGYIFLTFTIYGFYDIVKLWGLGVPELLLRISFAIASVSALIAVWKLYRAD